MSKRSRRSVLRLAGAGLAALAMPLRAAADAPDGGVAELSAGARQAGESPAAADAGTRTESPAAEPATASVAAPEAAPTAAPQTAPAPAEDEKRPSLFSGAPEPDDPLELLYSRRLSFDEGQPLITVRVLEGRDSALLRALGPLQAWARSAEGRPEPVFKAPAPGAKSMKSMKAVKPPPAKGKLGKPASKIEAAKAAKAQKGPAAPAGPAGKWRVELQDGRPGVGASWVELEQVRYADKEGREAARTLWESRGVRVRLATVGDVYGIAGHVVDTRRWSLLAEGDATAEGAAAQARALGDRWGIRPQIHREVASRPQGLLRLFDPQGKVAAEGHGALELRCAQGLAVEQVEFGMGYAFHGFERRLYPGRLFACVDADGKLALVAAVPMERLVKGVVPSEIFARAHPEALKSQAVTARGEVLAKVGARHLGDPYLLCAEQHCQVYKGLAAELASTDRAVDATRGEALFTQKPQQPMEPRRLVDSVYSAVCGGYTEDNDAVWGGPADPSLRGRPDFPLTSPELSGFKDGIGEALVGRFVHQNPMPSYCMLSGFAPKDKVRWKKSFTDAEVAGLCAAFEIGAVQAMTVEGRGVSGRARALRIEGTKGQTRVLGELNIRKLFKMLPSGMFVVEREPGRWSFTGGGWGHGSGMCQTGAIGRALRGASYRQILGWYYSGASPERVY
jgi:SpoIID/LytB domain protein